MIAAIVLLTFGINLHSGPASFAPLAGSAQSGPVDQTAKKDDQKDEKKAGKKDNQKDEKKAGKKDDGKGEKKKSGKAKKPKDPNKAKKPKKNAPAPDGPLATDDDENAQPPLPAARKPVRVVWNQHPSVRFGKVLRLDFQAKFQEDGRWSYDGAETFAALTPWELHRSRIGIQGTLFKNIEFEIERELTEKELSERDIVEGLTKDSAWKDVNVNFAYINNAQIRVGKFKVPFGLDQLTGVSQNDFVFRSLGANYLAPARDIGGMVHGRFFKRGLNYWAGIFGHDGDNARSKKIQGGDRTFAGRVTVTPFRAIPPIGGIEVGTAMTVTRVQDDSFRPNGLRGRTIVTRDSIFSPVYVKGTRTRWEADVDWMKGPGSLRAEYTHVFDERLKQGFGDDDLPKARYQSWYVSGSWLLTGETKERPLRPSAELLGGGFGAVEVVGRIERIWFDSVKGADDSPAFANPRSYNMLLTGEKAVTLGVNWMVNRFAKLQFNLIREHPEDPGRHPVANGAAFWSRVFRLQLVL